MAEKVLAGLPRACCAAHRCSGKVKVVVAVIATGVAILKLVASLPTLLVATAIACIGIHLTTRIIVAQISLVGSNAATMSIKRRARTSAPPLPSSLCSSLSSISVIACILLRTLEAVSRVACERKCSAIHHTIIERRRGFGKRTK